MKTVLVIDDDTFIRDFYSRLLESRGFSVTAAENGMEALKLCYGRKEPFDIAIIDWIMPVMTGEAVKKHLEEKYPDMPIIIASGSVDPAEVQLRENQVFLLKPFSVNDLIKTIGLLSPEGA